MNNLDKIFIDGAAEGFVSAIMPMTAFSTYVFDAVANLNDTVTIPYATASISSPFNASTGYGSSSTIGVNGKKIVLSNLLTQHVVLTDQDMTHLTSELAVAVANQAGAQLAVDAISCSLQLMTDTNFNTTSAYTSTQFTSSTAIIGIDKQTNDLKWGTNRTLVCGNGLWQNILLNTSLINSAAAFGSALPVQSAEITKYFGFTPYKTNTTLSNGWQGFVCAPTCIGIANALHAAPDTNNFVRTTPIQDTKTGLRFLHRKWYDANLACTHYVYEVLLGSGVIEPTAVIAIK